MKPPKITINLNQFTINKNNNGFCENYTSIENSKNNSLNNLLVLVSVETSNSELSDSIKIIASDIKLDFIKNKGLNSKIRFENAIKSAEQSIKKNKVPTGTLNILIAYSSNNELYFSKHGKIYACIFKNGQLTNVSPRNKKITTATKTSYKTFPYIINGDLQKNDSVIFFNDSIGNICDQNQIETFLGNNPNENISEFKAHLENHLTENNKLENLILALLSAQSQVIQNIAATIELPADNQKEQTDESSANNLDSVEVVAINKQKLPQQVSAAINKVAQLTDRIKIPQIKIFASIQSINISALSNKVKEMSSQLLSVTSNIKLTRKNKVAISLIALVILFSSVQVYRKVIAKNQFENLASQVNQMRSDAAALIASNNHALAITKLVEAKNVSTSIQFQSSDFTDESKKLSEDVETELNKTAKITVINNPEKISELSNFGIKFIPQRLFAIDNQIIITGSEFGLTYKIDLENKRKGFSFFSTIEDTVVATIKSLNYMAFFTDKNLFIYNPQKKSIADFEFAKKDSQVIAMDDKTIEILNRDTNQISIFSKNNFSSMGKISLDAQIKDISSNGMNFFALSEDAKIIKVSSKQEQIVDLNSSIPLLKNPDSIVGDQSTGNIYIINKLEKQIAAFNEEGDLIKQYNLKGFEKITDVFFDNNNIFILAPAAVFRIDL